HGMAQQMRCFLGIGPFATAAKMFLAACRLAAQTSAKSASARGRRLSQARPAWGSHPRRGLDAARLRSWDLPLSLRPHDVDRCETSDYSSVWAGSSLMISAGLRPPLSRVEDWRRCSVGPAYPLALRFR